MTGRQGGFSVALGILYRAKREVLFWCMYGSNLYLAVCSESPEKDEDYSNNHFLNFSLFSLTSH